MKKYQVFLLSYKGAQYLESWFNPDNYPNCDTYILDNGGQQWGKLKNNVIHTLNKNIGCAGGWNVICDIAFKSKNLDKIIIGQDDAIYEENWISPLYHLTTPNSLPGTYSNGFHFSLFGLHRNLWEKIGRFDENFFNCSSEDYDYIYRCLNNGIYNFPNLGISNRYNLNMVSSTIGKQTQINQKYLLDKWGATTSEWLNGWRGENELYKQPFNSEPKPKFVQQLIDYYPEVLNTNKFPSEIEYGKYQHSYTNS
jgi:hypothetical protein